MKGNEGAQGAFCAGSGRPRPRWGERLLGVYLTLSLVMVVLVHARPLAFYRLNVCVLELIFVAGFLTLPGVERRLRVRMRRSSVLLLMGWGCWAALACLWSEYPAFSSIRQAAWFSHVLFGMCAWMFYVRFPAYRPWMVPALPLGLMVPAGWILWRWYTLEEPASYHWVGHLRFYSHIRHLGYHALAGVLFSTALCLGYVDGWPSRSSSSPGGSARCAGVGEVVGGASEVGTRSAGRRASTRSARGRILYAWMSLSLSWFLAVWTGGRAVIAAALLGSLLILRWHGCRGWRLGRGDWGIRGIFIPGAVLSGVGLAFVYRVGRPLMDPAAVVARSIGVRNLDEALTGRLQMWRHVWEAWRPHPFFGLGPDGYLFIEPSLYGVQPHNFILQSLVEWGIPGTLLILGFISGIVVRGWRRCGCAAGGSGGRNPLGRESRRLHAVWTSFLLMAFLVGLVDGVFYHDLPLLLISVVVAGMASERDGEKGGALSETRMWEGSPSVLRLGLGGLGLVVAVAVGWQAVVLNILYSETVPAPDGWRAALIRTYPSSTLRLGRWIEAWAKTNPKEALEWAHWARKNSPSSGYYGEIESRLLRADGGGEDD